MKYYKLTLLRDLPTVDAGYSFTVDENKLKEWDSSMVIYIAGKKKKKTKC